MATVLDDIEALISKTPTAEDLTNKAKEVYDAAIEAGLASMNSAERDPGEGLGDPVSLEEELKSDFGDISESFADFTSPSPAAFRDLALELNEVRSDSGPLTEAEITQHEAVVTYLENWDSEAVNAFRNDYMAKFGGILEENRWVVRNMIHSLCAIGMFYCTVRIDVENLANDTIKALNKLRDGASDDWESVLKIAGCVASVSVAGAASTTGLGGIALFGTVVSNAFVVPQEVKKINGRGNDVYYIVSDFLTALHEISADQEDGELSLKGYIETDIDEISGDKREDLVVEDLSLPDRAESPVDLKPS